MANTPPGDTTKLIPPPRRGPRYIDLLLAAIAGSLATVLAIALLFLGNQRLGILPSATSPSPSASTSPSASFSPIRITTPTPSDAPTSAPPASTPPPATSAPVASTPPPTPRPSTPAPTPRPTKTP